MKIYTSNKLTVILPLKERKQFTKRFFRYLSKINFPYKIIIADGSKNKLSKNILNILKISNINYDYYKFPEDKNYNLFLKKIYKSLTLVKTKYVMLFSDDDFPILYSIKRLINFLEKNNTYKVAGGYLINFDLFKKSNKNIKEDTYGIPINFSKFFDQSSCSNKTPFNRLKYYLTEGSESTWHNIFRKEAILESYKKSRNVKFKNCQFSDWLVDSLNYISGKIKKINTPMLLHQHHILSEINNRLSFSMILKSKTFIQDKSYFLFLLKKYIPNKKKQIEIFINNFFLKEKQIIIRSNNLTGRKIIKSFLSFFMKKNIINFYKIILFYYLYINNNHFKYFIKNYFSYKNIYIKKELLFFYNFIKKS
jgi:glycosyltransferase domain-containing protein